MIKGFRDFILRGNVIDLAVAVVIGAAFTGIVNVLVAALINPLIGVIFQSGDLETAFQVGVPTLSGGESVFAFGAILAAIINFLAVAAVVYFVFVVPMNHAKKKAAEFAGVKKEPEEVAPPLPTEAELLIQIRDLLQQRNDGGASLTSSAPVPPLPPTPPVAR